MLPEGRKRRMRKIELRSLIGVAQQILRMLKSIRMR
jgi:hypothetical protein